MQFANYFFKNLAYVLGIYLGVGSILQSVKRICKLKKVNFLNGNEQIAMFRNDRNKKNKNWAKEKWAPLPIKPEFFINPL